MMFDKNKIIEMVEEQMILFKSTKKNNELRGKSKIESALSNNQS